MKAAVCWIWTILKYFFVSKISWDCPCKQFLIWSNQVGFTNCLQAFYLSIFQRSAHARWSDSLYANHRTIIEYFVHVISNACSSTPSIVWFLFLLTKLHTYFPSFRSYITFINLSILNWYVVKRVSVTFCLDIFYCWNSVSRLQVNKY